MIYVFFCLLCVSIHQILMPNSKFSVTVSLSVIIYREIKFIFYGQAFLYRCFVYREFYKYLFALSLSIKMCSYMQLFGIFFASHTVYPLRFTYLSLHILYRCTLTIKSLQILEHLSKCHLQSLHEMLFLCILNFNTEFVTSLK